jgi:hypothetical protein
VHICLCFLTRWAGLGIAHGPALQAGPLCMHILSLTLHTDQCIDSQACICFGTHVPALRLAWLRWLYVDLLWCG